MPEQITKEEIMSLDQAIGIIGKKPEDLPHDILLSFRQTYENRSDIPKEQIILAKNLVMRASISAQMKEKRFFEIVSPFDDSCIHCKGAGEIYKFDRKPVEVNCHICAGKTQVLAPCRSCEGTGRYIRSFKEGGGINIKCRTCKGEGKLMVKCSNCRGYGTIPKIVPAHTIKSTTPCKCDELGFTTNKDPKKKPKYISKPPGTPVLDENQAATLTEMIQNSN